MCPSSGICRRRRVRRADPPVIGRIEDDTVVLDLRAVLRRQDGDLATAVATAYESASDGVQPDGR